MFSPRIAVCVSMLTIGDAEIAPEVGLNRTTYEFKSVKLLSTPLRVAAFRANAFLAKVFGSRGIVTLSILPI